MLHNGKQKHTRNEGYSIGNSQPPSAFTPVLHSQPPPPLPSVPQGGKTSALEVKNHFRLCSPPPARDFSIVVLVIDQPSRFPFGVGEEGG